MPGVSACLPGRSGPLSDQQDDPEKIPHKLYQFLKHNNRESLLFPMNKFIFAHLKYSPPRIFIDNITVIHEQDEL
jgi:hypothetical protein